ncbi:segregation and condensation protein A [Aeromicrobium sp. UBA7512]|uniref:segregation and condensation protein A n=1 Tax=Aeromicrobium sp. UBA7512 TaxID=1945962 RepID=UPI0039C867F4
MSVTEPAPAQAPDAGFSVSLGNFEGPFDLLLQLISKHQLDITEVALSVVTSDFIAYTRELEDDLEQTTHFLLIAATLLDLKTARLLPQAEVEDEEDLALLEARDLLFARLMQYRAFKTVAAILAERFENSQLRHPRAATLEPRFATLLPEVEIRATAQDLAELAAGALAPKLPPLVSLTHLHAPAVSVREQAHLVVDRLRREGSLTFRAIVADAPDGQTKVARFLSLLELFREGMLSFEQAVPLGELTVRWTGTDDGDIDVGDEFDEPTLTDEGLDAAQDAPTAEPTGSDDDRD